LLRFTRMSGKERSNSSSEKQAAPQNELVADSNMDASEKKAEEIEVKRSESQSEKTTPEPAGSTEVAPTENTSNTKDGDKESKSEIKDAKKDKKEKEKKEKAAKPPKEEKPKEPKETKRNSRRLSIRGAPGVGTNVNYFSELVDPKKKNRRLLRTLVLQSTHICANNSNR